MITRFFNWLWTAFFGPSAPKEIWKTEREEFLRKEERWSADPSWPIDDYAVYAIHQTSVTTGNKRVYEEWRLV